MSGSSLTKKKVSWWLRLWCALNGHSGLSGHVVYGGGKQWDCKRCGAKDVL